MLTLSVKPIGQWPIILDIYVRCAFSISILYYSFSISNYRSSYNFGLPVVFPGPKNDTCIMPFFPLPYRDNKSKYVILPNSQIRPSSSQTMTRTTSNFRGELQVRHASISSFTRPPTRRRRLRCCTPTTGRILQWPAGHIDAEIYYQSVCANIITSITIREFHGQTGRAKSSNPAENGME